MLPSAVILTPSDRQIVVVRVFHAPQAMVWDAMTKGELLKRWLTGPPGWSMTECNGELTVGGRFRWTWCGPDGQSMILRGVNLEIVPRERIVRTEAFACDCECSSPTDEKIATMVLTSPDGDGDGSGKPLTSLSLTLLYPSSAARDAALASGGAQAIVAGYDGLDGLLEAMQGRAGRSEAA
jgi:uncharacterized protein YndB with AHSA1/START domain